MRFVVFAAALALAACATTSTPGWTGEGAEPFEAARAACDREALADTPEYEACMAARCWRRGD